MTALNSAARAHALPRQVRQSLPIFGARKAFGSAVHGGRRTHGRKAHVITAEAGVSVDSAPLKQKLMDVVAAKPGCVYWTEEARPVLDSIIEAVSPEEIPQISAEGIRGKYKQLLNSTILVEDDDTTTLGKLCFNQFEPKDLKVKLLGTQLFQGVDSPDQYTVVTAFEVLEGDLEGIVGEQKALGRYEVRGEQRGRQDIFFSGIQIAARESRFSGAWVTALAEVNPNMEESGIASATFPNEIAGFRDFKICDDDLIVSVGNQGSYIVVVPQ